MTRPLSRVHDSRCGSGGWYYDEDEPCAGPASPHECPYKADVNHDTASRCACCEACTKRCAEDI